MTEPTPCPRCGWAEPGHAPDCPEKRSADFDDEGTVRRLDPLIGMTVHDYVIQSRIGAGGMGVVYDALNSLLGRRAAVKVLQLEVAASPDQKHRFLAEARAVNSVRHRGIIDVFAFGELPDGRQYFIMELLEGVPLDIHIAGRRAVPVAEVLWVLDEVLAALGAAHAAGVIHRDVKPSNIFVATQPDGSRYVKLLDFGLAKQADLPGGSTPQTRSSAVVGTPHYMAPEQASGEPVSPRTDLYALGAVAYELLTGEPPFDHPSPYEVVHRHLTQPPPRPSAVRPDVPMELDGLVVSLLAKRPDDRPASAAVVRQQIERIRLRIAAGAGAVPTRPSALPTPSVSGLPASTQRYLVLRQARAAAPWVAAGLAALAAA